MVKRGSRKSLDRMHASKYHKVGKALLESARALQTVADDTDTFGNAIAVIAIHAAIAYTDAVSIAYGGIKSTSGDHTQASDTLKVALGPKAEPAKVRKLVSLLNRKDTVAYEGEYFGMDSATQVLNDTVEYCVWAEKMFQQRP